MEKLKVSKTKIALALIRDNWKITDIDLILKELSNTKADNIIIVE